jgi:hypothetical protein
MLLHASPSVIVVGHVVQSPGPPGQSHVPSDPQTQAVQPSYAHVLPAAVHDAPVVGATAGHPPPALPPVVPAPEPPLAPELLPVLVPVEGAE